MATTKRVERNCRWMDNNNNDDEDLDHVLWEQNIEQNLSQLQDTCIRWSVDSQETTKYRVVSSKYVRETAIVPSVQQTTKVVKEDAQSSCLKTRTKRKKTKKKRQQPVEKEQPKSNEVEMLHFVRQHRNEVQRFVLQNEKSRSEVWKQALESLGVKSTKKSKVPFPIFLGMQRKQKQRKARLQSKTCVVTSRRK